MGNMEDVSQNCEPFWSEVNYLSTTLDSKSKFPALSFFGQEGPCQKFFVV